MRTIIIIGFSLLIFSCQNNVQEEAKLTYLESSMLQDSVSVNLPEFKHGFPFFKNDSVEYINVYVLNDSTIQKDIDTFLNSYTKKHITKAGDEEQFNSPLTELSLIQESGKNYYLSDLNSKSDLPIEIFIYALLKFVQKESKISKVSKVNFKSLLLAPFSPGRIFRLSELGLGEKLDAAQDYSNDSISWLDTSGLRQVSVDSSYLNQEQVVLDSYYKGASNV